jgi:SNF2 family DNA or RNA helicase
MTVHAEIHPDKADRIKITADYREKDLIRSVPGASWSKRDGFWSVPLTWSSCLALRGIFTDRLSIAENLNSWASRYIFNVIQPSLALREALDAPGDPNLYPFQRAGVAFLSQEGLNFYSLEDEPGSGKSAQIIHALKTRSERGEEVFPALIVAPNSVKKGWEREFAKFWPDSGLRISVVDGSAVKRRKQLDPEIADVYVINWESLRSHARLAAYGSIALRRCVECGGEDTSVTVARCHAHEKELNQIPFKTVVADEVHRAKDPASAQSRALGGVSHGAELVYAVTGTPVTNSPIDFWAILHYLSPREFPTKVKWIDRYVHYANNPWGGMTVYGLNKETMDEFHSATSYFRRGLPKAITLPFLPPVVSERRDAQMTPPQKKAYDQMRDLLMTRLDDDTLLHAANPMTQNLRLVQFASASAEIIRNEETGDERVVLSEPSGKINAFVEDVIEGDFGDRSVVVFAQSIQLINLLGARLTKEGIGYCRITGDEDATMRQKAIDDFQAGRYQYILCTLGAGSTGITLTKASVMVFLQRSWSPTEMTQAENRAHRIGSEEHESILRIDYVTEGTVEESVLSALAEKEGYMEEVCRNKDLMRRFLEGTL